MTYMHGHHESVLRSHKWRTVDNSAAYLGPHLTSGTSVIDLGCGPGTITADIGRRVAPGRVLGIDASADVIEVARRDAGGGANVALKTQTIMAGSFRAGAVGATINRNDSQFNRQVAVRGLSWGNHGPTGARCA